MSMAALFPLQPTYAGGPVREGDIVTAQPEENILRGNLAPVPLIIGTTGSDLPAVFPPDKARPLDFFGVDRDRARQLYNPTGKLKPEIVYALIGVDMSMHEPARFVARQMTQQGAPAWLYRFDYVADSQRPKVTSAPHASELSFLFNQVPARYGKNVTARDQTVAKTFHQYFVNFAKQGDPNGAGLPRWQQFEPTTFDIMLFNMNGQAQQQPDPWRDRLALVEQAMDARTAFVGAPHLVAVGEISRGR